VFKFSFGNWCPGSVLIALKDHIEVSQRTKDRNRITVHLIYHILMCLYKSGPLHPRHYRNTK